ncbi:hypothetical protein D9M72_300450 [compost metagenome]
MLGIAQVEHVRPGDEDIVEYSHAVQFVALRGERVLDGIVLDHALAADDGHARSVDRRGGKDDLVARDAGAEEHADVDPVGKGDAGADRLDPRHDDAPVVLLDHAQPGRALLGIRVRAVHLRVDELRRAVQVMLLGEVDEVDDVLRLDLALGADCLRFPRRRIVDVGLEHVVVDVRRAWE